MKAIQRNLKITANNVIFSVIRHLSFQPLPCTGGECTVQVFNTCIGKGLLYASNLMPDYPHRCENDTLKAPPLLTCMSFISVARRQTWIS